jgi:hypothetical protein
MNDLRRFSVPLVVAPLVVSRAPSPILGAAELSLMLALVVVAIALGPNAIRSSRAWRNVALVSFLGLVAVPPTAQAFLPSVPAWTAGPLVLGYLVLHASAAAGPAPKVGPNLRTGQLSSLARFVPLGIVLGACLLLPRAYQAWLPNTILASWEFADVLGIVLGVVWLAGLTLCLSFLINVLRPRSVPTAEPRGQPLSNETFV